MSHGTQASPLQEVARSMGRGLRVGVMDSFEGGFVGGLLQLRIADPAAGRLNVGCGPGAVAKM